MPLIDTIGYKLKNPSFGLVGQTDTIDHQILWAIAITLGYPPELDGKALDPIAKDSTYLNQSTWRNKLVLTWKIKRLALIILERYEYY